MTVALRSAGPRVASGPQVATLAPLDWVTGVYAICSVSILTARSLSGDPRIDRLEFAALIVAHGFLFLLVALAPLARREGRRLGTLLANWYPLVVLLAIYASIGLVNAPRALLGHSFDPQVLYWEAKLFDGRFLTHYAGHSGTPTLTWLLGMSYLGFFPMVIASPLVLWNMGRTEHACRAIFGITTTFFACYLMFLLFPVAGPAYIWGWPDTQSDADLPVRLVRLLNDRHDSWGSAFPSSHVAASVTAVALAMTGCRRLGVALAPFAVGILLAVVYFRVHYALDAIAGLLVAGAILWLVTKAWPLPQSAER